jgi:hypothetical protein
MTPLRYVSENALMPGSGRLQYSVSDLASAQQLTRQFHTLAVQLKHGETKYSYDHIDYHEHSANNEWCRLCSNWISQAFEDRGLDTHVYWTNIFNNLICEIRLTTVRTQGVVITGIQRAGKGDGTEGIVLSTLFTHHSNVSYTRSHLPSEISNAPIGGVGILLSIVEYLQSSKWLAKDILCSLFCSVCTFYMLLLAVVCVCCLL